MCNSKEIGYKDKLTLEVMVSVIDSNRVFDYFSDCVSFN